ncbi:MAG: kynureninase [Acidobacteria bacterium]|nr:kynureninase [Acidobacteriota bacterium]
MTAEALFASPNALAPHYRRFRVAERLLLTGHSHQAWPDRALEGQQRAWLDAAELVDDKWGRAFERADRVRNGFARLLQDDEGLYALGANTHELVIRFLSALPLDRRRRLVTTDGEFHTLRRQLARLSEAGFDVVSVPADPPEDIAPRLVAAVDDRTAAVLVSAVLFQNSRIVQGLGEVAAAARRCGAELLVDVYHALGVVPFSLSEQGLDESFVVGGGYKYCQLGEGNCFLRLPPRREFRPVVTGWFSEFSALAESGPGGTVSYGQGADVFAGSTYDPTSHYRASEVFDFFAEAGLTPELLRRVSQHQVGLLARAVDELDLPAELLGRDLRAPLSEIGGFLALSSPRAGELCDGLRRAGVLTDHRRGVLRLGPAPYLADEQLLEAVACLGAVARELLV